MGAGLDWAEIEYQFLCEIQKMTELKGCTSVVLPEAKKIAGQILLWIEGTYLPTWEKDLAQGNIEDAVSSVVALEKAKLVVPEFIIFVDEIEFLTKDAIDGKLWKTEIKARSFQDLQDLAQLQTFHRWRDQRDTSEIPAR